MAVQLSRSDLLFHWLAAGEPAASLSLLRSFFSDLDQPPDLQLRVIREASRLIPPREVLAATATLWASMEQSPEFLQQRLRLELAVADRSAAMQTCRRWKETSPDDPFPGAEELRLSLFCEKQSLETYHADVCSWASSHWTSPHLPLSTAPFSTTGKLRVAYLSQTFVGLPRASLLQPLLHLHDGAAFEVFCYATADSTEPPCALSIHFRNAVGLNDRALVALLKSDSIDLAINVDGLMDLDSLGAFALGCAPRQLALPNYFASTGLNCFRGRLAHPRLEPVAETQHLYSEPLAAISIAPYTYTPPRPSPLLIAPPHHRNGYRTIGCFNHALKWTPPLFDLLARILLAHSEARLLLHCPGLEGFLADKFREAIGQRGGDLNRVTCISSLSHFDHLDLHNHVDFFIDTFPFHGATTTLEALWMGKPVLTLASQGIRSNFSSLAMREIGLPEFVADSPEEWMERALRFSGWEPLPQPWEIRDRFAASCFMDYKAWIRGLEDWYRNVADET